MSVEFGEFTFDWDGRQLFRAAAPVHVSPKALELLHVLVERRPSAVSKAELHETLWPSTFISDATLTSLVGDLRRSLDERARQGRFVRTVHRFGYAFCGTVLERPSRHVRRARAGAGCWVICEIGQIALYEGDNLLGRDRDVAVWFDSVDVSRRHANISIAGDQAMLEDLDSRNGTFVGGERVTRPYRLADGDRIGLGSVTVTFRVAAASGSTQSRRSPRAPR
jgi:DNA-binding winged helix-turn-helix (wHTH) protein